MSQANAIFNNNTLINKLKQLLMNAGDCILDIYHLSNLDIKTKSDNSPVTKADIAAHTLLFNGLSNLTPTIPVISEEDNESLSLSRFHSTYWLIDPLDGTKEFISRNGEFTVNVALIENNKPSLGFVCVPTKKTLYWGGTNYGSFKSIENLNKSKVIYASYPQNPIRVVTSRSHLNQATIDFINTLGITKLIKAGSSLKFLTIAEGKADYYPRFAPTSEWDTAAAHAILEGAGGKVNKADGSNLSYGKLNILNPSFIARGKN
jgi:3'(2'), 5'-bisphosphate nucleotidase